MIQRKHLRNACSISILYLTFFKISLERLFSRGHNLLDLSFMGCFMFFAGDTYYHLAKASQACKVSVHEQQHADVICRFYEDLSGENPCRVQRIQWKKVDVGAVLSVNDSVKYGVWEGIPGWGVSDGERLSLLRIRDVQYPDTGLYMCEITCQSKQGMKKYTRLAEVCMRQRVNNMGKWNFDYDH